MGGKITDFFMDQQSRVFANVSEQKGRCTVCALLASDAVHRGSGENPHNFIPRIKGFRIEYLALTPPSVVYCPTCGKSDNVTVRLPRGYYCWDVCGNPRKCAPPKCVCAHGKSTH